MSSITVRSPPDPLPYYVINQHADLITSNNQDERQLALDFAVRFAIYVTLMVVITIIVFLIKKYMKDCNCEATIEQGTATETDRLMSKETTSSTYGTCDDEQDLESGNWSSRSSSSEDDLYDANICVICYDHSRNCFFVPCGHCASCYACAKRIIDGENKNCPICRRLIHKVRKMFTS